MPYDLTPFTKTHAAPLLSMDRLRLRPHNLSDLENLCAMWSDPEVIHHIGPPKTRAEAWSSLRSNQGHWALLGYGYWAIQTHESDEMIGEAGLGNFLHDISPPFDDRPEAG